ncbi:Sensor kinase protein RcsC [Raoultella terrigena]|uniref:Sensor kinase protein RcsC n=1 Tax=Raoultella terrigena TaxID=577 RepID=A0A3P8JQS2_RAOTE|nr:Sensor kinase protein RcsC [Raoultella terrigena]
MNVTILDDNGQPLISLAGPDAKIKGEARWMQERIWFGYTSGFRELAMKKSLPPSSLSVVYSVSIDQVLERIRMLILQCDSAQYSDRSDAFRPRANVRAADLYPGGK